MGGKRASAGRSNSGGGGGGGGGGDRAGHMYPRISSGGSTKSFIMEPLSKELRKQKAAAAAAGEEHEEFLQEGLSSPRKSSFDIISLLEGQDDTVSPTTATGTGISTLKESREGLLRGLNCSSSNSRNGNNGNGTRLGIPSSETLPSFWHFVQPETTNHNSHHNELFRHHHSHQHKTLPRFRKEQISNHLANHKIISTYGNNGSSSTTTASSSQIKTSTGIMSATSAANTSTTGSNNPLPLLPPNKRMTKRRKVNKKTAQSARVAGFNKSLERNLDDDKVQRRGAEWLRVLTPPPPQHRQGTDAASACGDDDDDDDDDEEDELIRRYFSGLSSAGSSISWADDAMESEFTSQLSKLWEGVDNVCAGGTRPEKMSDAVYEECLQWRKAFPNANQNQRFNRNNVEVSPVESPTLEEENSDCGTVIDDAPFSSLVHSPTYYNRTGRKGLDDSVNTLQANFRTLNCATPRPNIEKSTEFVSAWLSECQNSYVPDHLQHRSNDPLSSLMDYNNSSRASSPPLSLKNHHPNSASVYDNFGDEEERRGKIRHRLRFVSDIARNSYSHYSRSHAKFVNEPNPENFFTSLALANNEIYGQGSASNTENSAAGFHLQSRINEYDEDGDVDDDEDGRDSPTTEIVSFRPNVRVQRPISSRVRDHTITPLSTSYNHTSTFSGIGSRHGINLNKQTGLASAAAAASSSINSRVNAITSSHEPSQRRMLGGMFENSATDSSTSPTQSALANGSRVRSGLGKQGLTLGYGGGGGRVSNKQPQQQQQQAPWSRHSGEDHLASDSNYVSSLYENYQSGSSGGGGGNGVGGNAASVPDRMGLRSGLHRSSGNNELMRSPTTSLKGGFLHNLERDRLFDGSPGSIPECGEADHSSYKPVASWLMNRRVAPNS